MSLVFLPLIAGALASANPQIGTTPTALSNCTFWLDGADITKWYKAGSVPVTADGDVCIFGIADAATTRSLKNTTTGPAYKINLIGSKNGVRWTGAAGEQMTMGTRSGTTQPATNSVSDLIGSSNFTLCGSIYVPAVTHNNTGNVFAWDGLLGDGGGEFGIFAGSSGVSTFDLALYVDSGGVKKATQSVNKSQWYVFGAKHDGSNIKLRINGGSYATTAAGAISTTTGVMAVNKISTFATVSQYDTTGIAIYKALLSDADLLGVERYFGAQVGLTF